MLCVQKLFSFVLGWVVQILRSSPDARNKTLCLKYWHMDRSKVIKGCSGEIIRQKAIIIRFYVLPKKHTAPNRYFFCSHIFPSLFFLPTALMEVYSDFFVYESGVYHRTNVINPQETGFHSVKVIGWGQENGIPYWVNNALISLALSTIKF